MRLGHECVGVLGPDTHHQAPLAAGAHGHVAADEEGETSEHLLFGDVWVAGDQLTDAVGEIFVVHHQGIVVYRRSDGALPIGIRLACSLPLREEQVRRPSARLSKCVRRAVAENPLVPRLATFYGIVIWMYRPDHPPAHFHAQCGEHVAQIELGTLRVMNGALPPRTLRLVREWAQLHPEELADNWALAQALEPLVAIEPLP